LKTSTLIAIGLAFAVGAAGSAAIAGESDAAREAVRVSYADLNLSNPADSAVMLERLRGAALEACGAPVQSVKDWRWAVRRSDCFEQSMARAVTQLHSPALSQAYSRQLALAAN
jgi:UrcA family protein